MPGLIPAPPFDGFHLGPLFVHVYALAYLVGITLAIVVTRRRWRAVGGDTALIEDVAIWGVPAGVVGGRIYFDLTTPRDIPPHWWGPFAVWDGGLGIWGGIALAAVVGVWRVRRAGASATLFMDAVAPGILVAQAVGRVGNYFNQELFGRPTTVPWALYVPPDHRPPGYATFATYHPTFAYEFVFDLAWAAVLIWLGHHRRIRPPGLFALYVAGYSAFRIFEETLRIDDSEHFLGLRLNTYVAAVVTLAGLVWFLAAQRPRGSGRRPDDDADGRETVGESCAPVADGDGVHESEGRTGEVEDAGDASGSTRPGNIP